MLYSPTWDTGPISVMRQCLVDCTGRVDPMVFAELVRRFWHLKDVQATSNRKALYMQMLSISATDTRRTSHP